MTVDKQKPTAKIATKRRFNFLSLFFSFGHSYNSISTIPTITMNNLTISIETPRRKSIHINNKNIV